MIMEANVSTVREIKGRAGVLEAGRKSSSGKGPALL